MSLRFWPSDANMEIGEPCPGDQGEVQYPVSFNGRPAGVLWQAPAVAGVDDPTWVYSPYRPAFSDMIADEWGLARSLTFEGAKAEVAWMLQEGFLKEFIAPDPATSVMIPDPRLIVDRDTLKEHLLAELDCTLVVDGGAEPAHQSMSFTVDGSLLDRGFKERLPELWQNLNPVASSQEDALTQVDNVDTSTPALLPVIKPVFSLHQTRFTIHVLPPYHTLADYVRIKDWSLLKGQGEVITDFDSFLATAHPQTKELRDMANDNVPDEKEQVRATESPPSFAGVF